MAMEAKKVMVRDDVVLMADEDAVPAKAQAEEVAQCAGADAVLRGCGRRSGLGRCVTISARPCSSTWVGSGRQRDGDTRNAPLG
jgi:hypothetical protein